jgi:hypothetical protein
MQALYDALLGIIRIVVFIVTLGFILLILLVLFGPLHPCRLEVEPATQQGADPETAKSGCIKAITDTWRDLSRNLPQ